VTTELLSVVGLSAAYAGNRVLDGVSVSVGAEECVAIVGESGSGKTTLARCIVGMHREFSGEVSLGGQRLRPLARHRGKDTLRRVQYIFQSPYMSLNPRKTIDAILDQPLRHYFDLARSERQARITQVLEDVSLADDLLGQYPDQLSGGERQRVAIARALVVEPDLLVCDEVTSALDVSVQAVVVELLRRLQIERQLAMIFITHNLALVRSIAQSAVVLWEGRVVERGAVPTVLDRPTEAYTVQLIADSPRVTAAAPSPSAPDSSVSAVELEPDEARPPTMPRPRGAGPLLSSFA